MNESYTKALQNQVDKIEASLARGSFEDVGNGHPTARELVAERRGLMKAMKILAEGPAADLGKLD